MKQQLILIFLFIAQFSFSQIVNIPDVNLKNALVNTLCVDTDGIGGFDDDVDTNNDGEIQITEAEAVIRLNISNQNIINLEGVFSFVNLEELFFDDNQVTGSFNATSLTNLVTLTGSANELTDVDISNLTFLNSVGFSGNQLTNILFTGSNNLAYFDVTNNFITTLDFTNFTNLISLNCYDNQITNLNLTGLVSLQYLICNKNNISVLDVSDSPNLLDLDCGMNQLSSLNLGALTNIASFDVSRNNLTSLNVSLLTEIDALRCFRNSLTSLDVSSLSNLVELDCSRNMISSLILSSTNTLTGLNCSDNQLGSLDVNITPNIVTLNCSNNQITSLNVTDLSFLEILDCSDNQLSLLDISTVSNVITLNCSYNQIVNLDVAELNYLEILDCSNNLLEHLFIKNGITENIYLYNNDNLTYVCSDEDEIETIQQNLEANNYINVVLNSYCSFVPGGDYYSLFGETKVDLDANGCSNSDSLYPNIKITVSNINGEASYYSNEIGLYNIPLQPNDYLITPVLENFNYFTITPSQINITINNNAYNQDFCIEANGIHNDLEATIIPILPARPGFNATYKIVYKNKGNLPISGSVKLEYNSNYLTYFSSNPIVSTQNLNELTWNYIDLIPFETREVFFEMVLNTPTNPNYPLNNNDVLVYNATIDPIVDDEVVVDNIFELNQTIVNSFDPNDKTCLEGNTIYEDGIGKFVHYLIRFENTGSASAVNIIVKDEIDLTKFDISTLVPISGSHSFETIIKETNKVEFVFKDVYLPFDDANNDGYISFKIKTLSTLQVGDVFQNKAEIYFDFNAAIITNITATNIESLLSVSNDLMLDVKVYPNPATDNVKIIATEEIKEVIIFDLVGRELAKQVFLLPLLEVNVGTKFLPTGTFFVKIITNNGHFTKKMSVK